MPWFISFSISFTSLKHPPGIHVELIDIHKGKRKSEPFQIVLRSLPHSRLQETCYSKSQFTKKHKWEPSLVCVAAASTQRWNWNGLISERWGMATHQGWCTKSSLSLSLQPGLREPTWNSSQMRWWHYGRHPGMGALWELRWPTLTPWISHVAFF